MQIDFSAHVICDGFDWTQHFATSSQKTWETSFGRGTWIGLHLHVSSVSSNTVLTFSPHPLVAGADVCAFGRCLWTLLSGG